MGKIFNKGLVQDDQKEGLFKRLKNIENAQKGLINGNNKPDSVRIKLSIPSIFDIISSKSEDKDEDEDEDENEDEDEDENEKTARELYQDSEIEGMKGLIMPGEEIKDEKSQMYLEKNLNEIKNTFSDIHNKYPRFFGYIAKKEKENINYEILLNKVDGINFYHKYNKLYNYLVKFSLEKTSIKNKSFLKDLSKGFNLKKGYTKNGENYIEKAYNNFVLGNKKIDDVFYKDAKNGLDYENKNIFQEAKKLFNLRVEIYKKLALEEENPEFEKSIGETVKSKNQNDNLSETPEEKKIIKYFDNKSKTIKYKLLKECFNFKVPSDLAKRLFERKDKKRNNELVELIRVRWSNLQDEIEQMSEDEKETEKTDKILEIYEDILIFNRKKQSGGGLKISTPNQMLSRLPITLAQLKAENNSEKLKNEIRQLLYFLYR